MLAVLARAALAARAFELRISVDELEQRAASIVRGGDGDGDGGDIDSGESGGGVGGGGSAGCLLPLSPVRGVAAAVEHAVGQPPRLADHALVFAPDPVDLALVLPEVD